MIRRRLVPVARRGFTLIELLVVISIIALLASLIAPAVQASRRAARKAECLNNMRNVGLAILNFSSSTGGDLPALSSTMPLSNLTGTGTMSVGWPITILPAIDNAALLRNIQANATLANGSAAISSSENIWLQVYTCPDDSDSYRQAGGLSYVVNAGFISAEVWGSTESSTFFHQPYLINWKGSTTGPYRSTDGTAATGAPSAIDLQVALASGVFWRTIGDSSQPGYRPSVDYVSGGDGTTTTLMLTENLNAGPWSSTSVNGIGFGIRIPVDSTNYAPRVGTGSPCGEFSSTLSLNSDFPCSTFVASSSGSLINEALTSTTTTAIATASSSTSTLVSAAACDSGGGTDSTVTPSSAPRPSSQHPGGVNSIMVDGSARFLSENIDGNVYAKLVTSNGATFSEQTLNQAAY